jgi:hypothetical protein
MSVAGTPAWSWARARIWIPVPRRSAMSAGVPGSSFRYHPRVRRSAVQRVATRCHWSPPARSSFSVEVSRCYRSLHGRPVEL